MTTPLVSLLIGCIFGLGLAVSELMNPARVLGFLDFAGAWDPTLVFVMAGAVAVTSLGYRTVLRRERSLLGAPCDVPTNTVIDARLLIGAALFGVGWGLAGFCPGPGLAALSAAQLKPVVFVASMVGGMALHRATIKA